MLSKNEPGRPARLGPHGPVELDLREYWRVVARRRWVIAAVFAAVVVLTLLVTLRTTKIFAATTTLIIDLNAPRVLDKEKVADVLESGTGGYWYSKEYYLTQYKVITSRAVAQRVVDRLQLARDLRFLELDDVQDPKKLEEELARTDAALELQRRLHVIPVKDSRVVGVQMLDRDPKWAATLANAVAEAYITESLSVRANATVGASDWLEQQLADLEQKLAASADALFRFKQANDIVATSWEDRQSMVSQRLVAMNDALTKARVQKAWLEARSEQIAALGDALDREDPQTEAFAIVSNSKTIQDLKVKYFETKVECADANDRYLPDHPKLEACEAKLRAARQGLTREIRTILDAARREYDEAVQSERKLNALLAETKAAAFALNRHEKEYLELKRAYDNNQRLYELVLQRLKETGVTGMMQMSNVRVLDRAEPPEKPIMPRPLYNLAIAGIAGIVLGIGLAFLLERLDTTFTTREQIEEQLHVPFLGIIPAIEKENATTRDTFVHTHPRSTAAECLRAIRTNLQFMSPDRSLRTILITSAGPAEGKTTTAAALAEIMADGGERVLLVDADMRRPRVHKVFGAVAECGLSSLIMGEGTMEALVQPTPVKNLSILPCGAIPPNPAELLNTTRFRDILADAIQHFDRVVIDSPPVGVVADAILVSTLVDGTLFVVKAATTSRVAAARCVGSIVAVNSRLFGAVMNSVDLNDQRYAQYSQYYTYGYDDSATASGMTAGKVA